MNSPGPSTPMSDTAAAKIEQFRRVTQQNPADPLGYFSLGRAQLDAGANDDAVASLQRALALDSRLSRAYQLLARAQIALGRREEAIKSLNDGVRIAQQRGDQMPKNEMIAMLVELGEPAPDFKPTGPALVVGEGQVLDARTGRPGARLAKAPFRNKLGEAILNNVSAESWKEWIAQGTKVINELRLPMHDPAAQKVYDQHMIDFLNLGPILEQSKASAS